LVLALLWTATSALAQTSAKPAWTAPRTPDGQPDLQGVWTNATLTPLERPASMAGKAFLTEAEAAAIEKRTAENRSATDKFGPLDLGSYNRFWYDDGTKVLATRQTSSSSIRRWAGAREAVCRSAARRLQCAQRRQLRVHEPVGSLHHARHSRIDVSSRLQQRVSDHPGAGIRRHSLRDDSRRPHHSARQSSAIGSHAVMDGGNRAAAGKATRWWSRR
jgi:hypothetical protein